MTTGAQVQLQLERRIAIAHVRRWWAVDRAMTILWAVFAMLATGSAICWLSFGDTSLGWMTTVGVACSWVATAGGVYARAEADDWIEELSQLGS